MLIGSEQKSILSGKILCHPEKYEEDAHDLFTFCSERKGVAGEIVASFSTEVKARPP